MKNRVGKPPVFSSMPGTHSQPLGRLRPDFLDRCKWDKALQACTGYVSCFLWLHIILTDDPWIETQTKSSMAESRSPLVILPRRMRE